MPGRVAIPRAALIGTLLALPAILAAMVIVAAEVSVRTHPQEVPFGDPPPRSLADAITRGFGVEQAFAFIDAGQDPNVPIAVDDPNYAAGETVDASPLLVAIAARDANTAQMLLNFGARIELPQNHLAGCLAREIGDRTLESIVAAAWASVGPPPPCPERDRTAKTTLIAWSHEP